MGSMGASVRMSWLGPLIERDAKAPSDRRRRRWRDAQIPAVRVDATVMTFCSYFRDPSPRFPYQRLAAVLAASERTWPR